MVRITILLIADYCAVGKDGRIDTRRIVVVNTAPGSLNPRQRGGGGGGGGSSSGSCRAGGIRLPAGEVDGGLEAMRLERLVRHARGTRGQIELTSRQRAGILSCPPQRVESGGFKRRGDAPQLVFCSLFFLFFSFFPFVCECCLNSLD